VLAGFAKPPAYSEVKMKKFLFVVCLFASSSAFAEAAMWTGNKQQIQTEDGRVKWSCEYRVPNTTAVILFWREFFDACPSEVESF